MSRPVDALIEFLRAEEARGVTHVHLDEGARQVLRELNARSKRPAAAAPTPPPSRPAPQGPAFSLFDHPDPLPTPRPAPVLAEVRASDGSAAEQIAALKAQARNWSPARSLGTLRDTMVFSVGNPEADLMLVGEAPGYQEERQGEPFVGPAGQKLTDILRAMGLGREAVYISNIVKFRPAIAGQTTNNRPPTDEEMASCLPFIRREIGIVRPKCIVALGGTASKGLLGTEEGVARMRGRWHEFEGVPVRVTYHPSYLLRTTSGNLDKRKVWEDMLEVMELLGMPVSEKQRGFFLK
ncbi:uracil-DNA glycosylase family protein [Luteolibacter ambystomatis]|nr:uracil-DNA glycosylase [Luteolibacter ambystomatis]